MPVYLRATLDTKGPEAAYLRDRLHDRGVEVTLMDDGCLGKSHPPRPTTHAKRTNL